MQAVLFAPPILLAVAMGLAASGSKFAWGMAILGIAVFQSIVLAVAAPVQELAGALAVSVVIPWALVGTFLRLSTYPRRPALVALALPAIYVATLAVGVIVAVNLGVVHL